MDPYMAGRPVDIEIVKTTGQIPSIIHIIKINYT
jgi:hypothetical protein